MDILQNTFIGLILQGIFYGLYCVIFILYLRIQLRKKHELKGLLFYALATNFILCTAFLVVGVASFIESFLMLDSSPYVQLSLLIGGDVLYICIDLISQGILIYRCWLMWRRPYIVIVPIILSLACLAILLAALVPPIKYLQEGIEKYPNWWTPMVVASFSISLAVNAVVTALIILKIVIVRRGLRDVFKSRKSYSHITRGILSVYPIIWILVEASMITFVGQLAQTILWTIQDSTAVPLVSGIVVQLYGMSPTVVVVRAAMGLSHDNKPSNLPTSQAIHLAEIQSDDNRTLDVSTGNNLMDKH